MADTLTNSDIVNEIREKAQSELGDLRNGLRTIVAIDKEMKDVPGELARLQGQGDTNSKRIDYLMDTRRPELAADSQKAVAAMMETQTKIDVIIQQTLNAHQVSMDSARGHEVEAAVRGETIERLQKEYQATGQKAPESAAVSHPVHDIAEGKLGGFAPLKPVVSVNVPLQNVASRKV